MPSVFAKLRRNSKLLGSTEPEPDRPLQSMVVKRPGKVPAVEHDSNPPQDIPSPPRCRFLELPPELRTQIYDLIASTTRLSPPPVPAKAPRPRAPAFLLACKQTRREFMPILFAMASVSISITCLDFSPLVRITGGLYRAQLMALRENPNLVIVLKIGMKCYTPQLRRWLTKRAQYMDRLPWNYEIERVKPGNALTRVKMLDAYLSTIDALKKTLHESLQMEVLPIEVALIKQRVRDSTQLTGQPLLDFFAGMR
ncbi:ferrochelatase hem15 [Oleoguttula sp. CCFEE 5521]